MLGDAGAVSHYRKGRRSMKTVVGQHKTTGRNASASSSVRLRGKTASEALQDSTSKQVDAESVAKGPVVQYSKHGNVQKKGGLQQRSTNSKPVRGDNCKAGDHFSGIPPKHTCGDSRAGSDKSNYNVELSNGNGKDTMVDNEKLAFCGLGGRDMSDNSCHHSDADGYTCSGYDAASDTDGGGVDTLYPYDDDSLRRG